MNVVMLSDMETYGGAATSATRLAEGLVQGGHQVTRIVNVPSGKNHSWKTIQIQTHHTLISRLIQRVMTRDVVKSNQIAALDQLTNHLHAIQPEIINVHNLHGGISAGWTYDFVRVCRDIAPTVWTLHDMWSFTGRCAYSYDCRKFITGCDASCPTPDEYPALAPNKIAEEWRSRQQFLKNSSSVTCVTPSRWMSEEAKAGLWSGSKVEVIPYGLSMDTFMPFERSKARMQLGINSNGIVLMTAAQNFDERRKGLSFLQEAWPEIADQDVTLITLGEGGIQNPMKRGNIQSLGYIDNESTMALAYSAADLLIHPAPVDNFPNVLIEALACGTPAVGFPVCGIPELIRPEITGWLADKVSAASLAKSVKKAIGEIRQGLDLRERCRKTAEKEYDLHLQSARYTDLFNKMTKQDYRNTD